MPHLVKTPKALLPSLVFVFLAAAASGEASEFPDPRSMPSLEIEWRWGKTWIQDLVIDGDVIYAFGFRFAAALDADTGAPLWTTRFQDSLASRFDTRPILATAQDRRRRLAVAYGTEVHVLDPENGLVDGVFPADANRVKIFGPPLVALLPRQQGGTELVRLDEATAQPLARRPFAGQIFAWTAYHGDVMITHTIQDEAGQYHTELLGLRDDLTTRWRVPLHDSGHFQTIRDDLYFEVLLDGNRRFFHLDPETGELDAPLPALPQPGEYLSATWEFAYRHTPAPADSRQRLRRYDLATGQPMWTRDLPARYLAHVEVGERLFVYCQPSSGGRGFLAELDPESGEMHRLAYALRRVQRLLAHGDSLIAATADGVVAFSAHAFGPPESATLPVDEEIRRLLGRLEGRRLPDPDVTAELIALGEDALPLLTTLAAEGRLNHVQLSIVAPVFRQAGYRPAAPVLRRLLDSDVARQPVTDGKHNFPSPRMQILRALAEIGGSADVDAVGRILLDGETELAEQRQAYFTLTAIGVPESLPWIDRFFEQTSPSAQSSAWWRPPDPRRWLELVENPPSAEMLEKSQEDVDTWHRLHRHRQIRIVEDEGKQFLVFPYRLLSWSDLWVAELADDATPATPVPLGISLRQLAGRSDTETALEARLEEGVLTLEVDGNGRGSESIVLADALRDSDGDGLTDGLEREIHLDPARADTDGDGLRDSEDLTPNTRPGQPRDADDEIALAIAEVYFTLLEPDDEAGGLAMAESAAGLEWRGRHGPTMNVDGETVRRMWHVAHDSAVVTFAIEPADLDAERAPQVDPAPGERVYVMTVSGGKAYTAVVGKIGSRWVVKSLGLWWIA